MRWEFTSWGKRSICFSIFLMYKKLSHIVIIIIDVVISLFQAGFSCADLSIGSSEIIILSKVEREMFPFSLKFAKGSRMMLLLYGSINLEFWWFVRLMVLSFKCEWVCSRGICNACYIPYSKMAANKVLLCLFACILALFASFSLQNSFVFYTCWWDEEW